MPRGVAVAPGLFRILAPGNISTTYDVSDDVGAITGINMDEKQLIDYFAQANDWTFDEADRWLEDHGIRAEYDDEAWWEMDSPPTRLDCKRISTAGEGMITGRRRRVRPFRNNVPALEFDDELADWNVLQ